jgi:CheY-like chemotaxis protein/anti-sigma regulatory factor (Ser/Thr protein kinase)
MFQTSVSKSLQGSRLPLEDPDMPKILVVDDAAVDRRLVEGLLRKDPDLQVVQAEQGRQALTRMAFDLPDLVLTDLVMPEMDGLELVTAIRQQHPLVPVIVMTSYGSEEIAVRALHAGAASYVTKKTLARDLLHVIHRVLNASGAQRSHARLMECLESRQATFMLGSDGTLIPALISHLQDLLKEMGLCDETDCIRTGVALGEALANALYHGNLGISSELRETDDRAYRALVEQRRDQTPYCHRKIQVIARLTREEAVFVIRDEGAGFDPACLPDPADPKNIERLSGRGLLLMRTFMDEMCFNEHGNEVTLTKRPRAALGERLACGST